MKLRGVVGFIFTVLACTPEGGHWQHFRISAFDQARDRNMSIAIHFFDEKNPLCKEQKEVLENLIKDKSYKTIGAYRVAWGAEEGLQKFLKTSSPCTLIGFKGYTERGRIDSSSDRRLLKTILDQAML